MATIAKRLDDLARAIAPAPASPAALPIAWDYRGPWLVNIRIADPLRWPGYIAGLMRAGVLAWERAKAWRGGVLECGHGPAVDPCSFDPERSAAMATVTDVMASLSEDYTLPENTAEMIQFLEGLQDAYDNKKT